MTQRWEEGIMIIYHYKELTVSVSSITLLPVGDMVLLESRLGLPINVYCKL